MSPTLRLRVIHERNYTFIRQKYGGLSMEMSFFTMPLAQTPGPDLACQDAVMESEAFISSENSCISTSRRTRGGWLTTHEFV